MKNIIGIFVALIVIVISGEVYSQNDLCANYGCNNHTRVSSLIDRNDYCQDSPTGEFTRLRNTDLANAAVQDAENQIHGGQCKQYVNKLLHDFCVDGLNGQGVTGYCSNYVAFGREIAFADAVRGDIIQLSDIEPFGECHDPELDLDDDGNLDDNQWHEGMHTAVFLSHTDTEGVINVAHSNAIVDCDLCPWSCVESEIEGQPPIYGNTATWRAANPNQTWTSCEITSLAPSLEQETQSWNARQQADNNNLHIRVFRFGEVCESWEYDAFTVGQPTICGEDPTDDGSCDDQRTAFDVTDNAHVVVPVSNADTDYVVKMVYRRNDHLVREKLGTEYDEKSSVAWIWEHREYLNQCGTNNIKVQPFRKECTPEERSQDTNGECEDFMPPGRWIVDVYVYAWCDHRDLDDEPNYTLTFDVEGNRFEIGSAQVCIGPGQIDQTDENAKSNHIYSCQAKAKNACYSESGICTGPNNAYEYESYQSINFLFGVNEVWQDFRYRMYIVNLETGEGSETPFNQIKWWNINAEPNGWRNAFYFPVIKARRPEGSEHDSLFGLQPGTYEIIPEFGEKDAVTTIPTYHRLTEESIIIIVK